MQKSRTIFIWDVQWCYDEMKLLLKKLKLKKSDKVYFTWDLINKWPKNFKTLKYLYKNNFRFNYIKGNHEVNFLRWLDWEKSEHEKEFKKLKKKIHKTKTNYLIKFLEDIPLYLEDENFILVHGGLIPNKTLKKHSEDEITRTREYNGKPWYEYYKWEKTVIYWHRAESGINIREMTKWIDSWCVYGKALTAYTLETWEIIQQNALDIYENVYNRKKRKWFLSFLR